MPRAQANIRLDLWANSDFRKLAPHARYLYLYLLSCPSLSYAGVADWRPVRMAPALGLSLDEIQSAATDLTAGAYIWVDEDTEEVFVRSFTRHDGVLKHARLPVSMANDYAAIGSARIRSFFAFELTRLHAEDPTLKAWEDTRLRAILKEDREDMKDAVHGNPLPKDFHSDPMHTEPKPLANGSQSLWQSDSMHTATATATATSSKDDGGATRQKPRRSLPASWVPNANHEKRAQDLNIDVTAEAEKFRNHAAAKDQKQANWDATFSNWIIKAGEWAKPTQRPANTAPDAYIWGQRA